MTSAATTFPGERRFIVSLYALVILSVGIFCQLHETLTPLVFTCAAASVAWLMVDSPRGKPLPKLVINTLLVLVALNFFREVRDDEFNLMLALGHFIIGLLCCKFFERKTTRDVTQILILSLLIVVATTMYSSTITFAVLLVIYFLLMVYTVSLLHLRQQTHAATSRLVTAALPANGDYLNMRRDLKLTTLRALVVLLPVALLVFLAVPRTRGSGFFQRLGGGGAFQTGFSEEVRFQDYGYLNQSDAEALEVTFFRDRLNVTAEIVDPYFRGRTLEIYNADLGRWTHAGINDATQIDLDSDNSAVLAPVSVYNQVVPLTQKYRMIARRRDDLFHIWPPLAVQIPKQESIRFDPRSSLLQANNPRILNEYEVQSLARPSQGVFPIETPPLHPPGSHRPTEQIASLARQIAGDLLPPGTLAQTPEQVQMIAGRIENYLKLNYPYSLEFQRESTDVEPITDFLLNRKQTGGHCEFFAASMVMLCRSVGIPARMVTGYHGGEFNSLSSTYLVRQRHAHAWVEYFVPDEGWVHSDPSPISATATYSNYMFARWFRELRQIVQNMWLNTVVTFDNESRQQFVAWIGSILGAYRDMDIWKADPWTRATFGFSLVGLAGVAIYAVVRVRRERLEMTLIAAGRRGARLTGDQAFLDVLLKLVGTRKRGSNGKLPSRLPGLRRPDQTPLEFIRDAEPLLGPATDDARWLVSTFYSIRYGRIPVDAAMRRRISESLKHVREAIRAHDRASAARA